MSTHQKVRKIQAGQTKGMVNAFVCPDLHCTITKNLDDGHTPQQVGCPVCDQPADSRNYNVNQNLAPSIEWYNISEAEMQAKMLAMKPKDAESFKAYVLRRGLISRPVENLTHDMKNLNEKA